MGNEGLLRSGLVIGLALLISFMFSGCSISVPPLRKYAPLPQQPVPIKFISKDDSGLTKNTLDLDIAIAFGMTNNHALKIAREEINIAEGQLQQAKLRQNPEIEFSINASSAADSVLGIAGSLLQPFSLFWPKQSVSISVAEASLERAKAEVQRFEWEMRVIIKRTYLQIILQQNEKVLFEQSLEIIKSLSSTTTRLKAGGEVSRLSELLVQSEVVQTKARLAEAESSLTKKRSEFAVLLGIPALPLLMDGTLEFPDSLDFEPAKLSRTFTSGNIEIYLRDAELRVATLEHAAASKSWWSMPSLGVTAERDTDAARLFGGLFSMELPIFNHNQGEIRSRSAALSKARIEREQAEFIGQHSLDRLIILLQQTMWLMSLYRDEGMPVIEENLILVQKAIAAGELSTLELVSASQQAIAMKLAYMQTRFAGVEILLDLEAVLGTPVFELQTVYAGPQENTTP